MLKKIIMLIAILSILISPMAISEIFINDRDQLSDFSLAKKPYNPIENVAIGAPFSIVYPRHSYPVITEDGGIFKIIIEDASFNSLLIKIETAYESVVDEIYLDVTEIEHIDELTYITVEIPKNTPEELYNLTVIMDDSNLKAVIEPRAVSIVNKLSDSFSFAHITDFHIGDIRGFTVDIKKTLGWKTAKKTIEEINVLKPDFVVITGDLLFGQLYPFEYSFEYRTCYRILQQFDVPTYLIPGNHDGYVQSFQDGFRFWDKFFGDLYYSFDYGNYHFVSVNSYDWPYISRIGFSYLVFNWGGSVLADQLSWIEDDLTSSNNANLTFMMMHHNPLWDTQDNSLLKRGYNGRENLIELIEEYGVDMVLSGHVHRDNVTVNNDIVYITTTSTAGGVRGEYYWGYRIIEIMDGAILSYNYKEPHFSIPLYNINYSFYDNNKIFWIENNLDTQIKAYCEFTLPINQYTIKNGDIIQERKNDEIMQIYAVTNVAPKSEKEIYVELF